MVFPSRWLATGTVSPTSSLPISTVYPAGNGARSSAPSDGLIYSLGDLCRQARGLHVIWDWVLGVSGGFDNLDGRHCHLSLPGNGHASGLSRILPLVLGPSFPPHLCMLLGKHWDWEDLFLELVSFLCALRLRLRATWQHWGSMSFLPLL